VNDCVDVVRTFDLDVVAGSVHFLDGENVVSRRSAWSRGELDADAVYTKYLDLLESMLDYDYFDMVCHLDLPKKYNARPSPSAVDRFGKVLEKIQARDLGVELNTSGLAYPVAEAFPSPQLLAQCARLEIPMVTGSDAHTPDAVGRSFDRARAQLEEAGYRHLTGYSHRQRERVSL
jgi:histidinol-phosphatase (PHP family)